MNTQPGKTPADAVARHQARLAAHAERVERELDGKVRQADGRPKRYWKGGLPEKPVISDRGEWFPSGTEASKAFHKHMSTIARCINDTGSRVAGRCWRFATPAETAAA